MGPKATIQNGTNTVDNSGTVYVADGTYQEHITISKNLSLIGQSTTGTIIDGTNNGRPLTITSGLSVNLTNFSIINGYCFFGIVTWSAPGAGIYNSGTLNMTNCNVENNTADGQSEGGGIYNSGTLYMTNCNVEKNRAIDFGEHSRSNGGGIYNSGIINMANCNVKNNTADATMLTYGEDANANGGGIYNSGTINMANCNVENNIVSTNWWRYDLSGGGIFNEGVLNISGGNIKNNLAICTSSSNSHWNYGGGGIYTTSILNITGCTLENNTFICNDPNPNDFGGGIFCYSGLVTANFNRIIDNSPNAIRNEGGTVNIEYNWWGSNEPVFGSLLSGVSPPTNWLYMTINATPSTINNTENSLVTVSFNNRYNGTTITPYIPGVGEYIPDGTPVTFSLTNGPFGTLTAPLTVNTLGGLASIIFTASNVGVQVVNGTLDYQNVTASITILAAHVDLDTFYADYDEFINNNHNIVPITGPVNYLDHVIVVFTATNMGPNPVTDLVLREDWPSELTGTGDVWHTFDGANWILDSYLAQGSFNLYPTYDGPLDVGDVCLVVFGATVNASNTIITNTVSTTEQDPIDDEGFDTASADLEVNPEVNVTITKTADHIRPNVGETVVFTIVANNNGPGTANNLVVTDTLPTGLDFVSCTDGGVWDPVTRTVTWRSSVVLNGANVTYYLTALVNSTILAGTNVTNVVNETHTEYPYNSTTNCTIYVPQADLYIQITSDKNNPRVGETFTLTYKLGNNGPDDATNVTITIPIPEGFHISSITGDGTWNIVENNIIWTFNNVKVGDPYLYITGWTTAAGNYIFTASISSNTFNLNSRGVNSLSINAQPQVNAATTNTIGMQKTGIPLVGIVLAIMMLIGGFIGTCKKQ